MIIRTLIATTFVTTLLHHTLNQKKQFSFLVIAWSKKLTVFIQQKYLAKMRPFNSAKTSCMHDHTKPTIREINPKHIILHVGTSDLKSEKNASQTANSIIEFANSLKNETNYPRFINSS